MPVKRTAWWPAGHMVPRIGLYWAAGMLNPAACFGAVSGPEKCPETVSIPGPFLVPERVPKRCQFRTRFGTQNVSPNGVNFILKMGTVSGPFRVQKRYPKHPPGQTCPAPLPQPPIFKNLCQGWATFFLNQLAGLVTHCAH